MKQEIQKILFLSIIILRNRICFSASVEAVIIKTLTDIILCMTWEFCWTFDWNFKIVSINERMINWIDSSNLKINISENNWTNYVNIIDSCWVCCSYIELNMFMLFSEIKTCFIHLVFEARFFVTYVQRRLSFLHTAEN